MYLLACTIGAIGLNLTLPARKYSSSCAACVDFGECRGGLFAFRYLGRRFWNKLSILTHEKLLSRTPRRGLLYIYTIYDIYINILKYMCPTHQSEAWKYAQLERISQKSWSVKNMWVSLILKVQILDSNNRGSSSKSSGTHNYTILRHCWVGSNVWWMHQSGLSVTLSNCHRWILITLLSIKDCSSLRESKPSMLPKTCLLCQSTIVML